LLLFSYEKEAKRLFFLALLQRRGGTGSLSVAADGSTENTRPFIIFDGTTNHPEWLG
jgi:hypothetical protein